MPRKIRRWRKKCMKFLLFISLLFSLFVCSKWNVPDTFNWIYYYRSNRQTFHFFGKKKNAVRILLTFDHEIKLVMDGSTWGSKEVGERGASPSQYSVCVSEFKKLSCKFNLLKFFGDKVFFRYRFLHPLTFLSYDTTTNLSKSGWMPRKK